MVNVSVLAAEAGAENTFLLPHDINEVIWGSLAFLIVAALIIWKGGPAIKNMWNARIERIKAELDTAEAARRQAEAELASVRSNLADADAERSRLLAEARTTADTVREQLIARSSTDADEVRARGLSDIEATKAQATGDLSAELGVLAIGAAEAVVTNTLDAAAQNELIEKYIAKVGAQR
jgi:F-type H+-transporting ATPase subunit b